MFKCYNFAGLASLLLAFVVLASTGISSVTTVIYDYSSWTLLAPEVSQRVVLYDRDGDGVAELLAIDDYLYSNLSTRISTGAIPLKVDIDATGVLCLVLYKSLTGELEAQCQLKRQIFSVPVNATLKSHKWGLLAYNATHKYVVAAGRLYSAPGDLEGVPILVNNTPAVIGLRGGRLVIHDLEVGEDRVVTLMKISVVQALYDGVRGVVYGVGFTDTTLVYFEYDGVSFSFKPLGLGELIDAVATTSRIYVLTRDGAFYAISSGGGITLVASGVVRLNYPADSVDSFVALTSRGVLKVIDVDGEIAKFEYSAPTLSLSDIYAVDWWGGILASATARGVYVATTEPIYVLIDAPASVYAGEPIEVGVRGVYDSVVVSVNGEIYTHTGNFTLTAVLSPGRAVVTARACRGVFCVENSTSILVLHRPLELKLNYPDRVRPYEPMTIHVETIDRLINESRMLVCNINDPKGYVQVTFTSGGSVTVPAIPDIDSAVFTVACGGGYYEVASATIRAKLTEPYLKVKLRYYGSGLLEVSGYDKYTGKNWDGLVAVEYLDLNLTVAEEGKVVVTIPPGTTRLKVSLAKGNITYHVEELTVIYYEDVFLVPAGEAVVVADRVKVDVYTLTETITHPVPIYHEVRIVDPLVIAATVVFTAGAVVAVLMLLGKLPRVARRGERAS